MNERNLSPSEIEVLRQSASSACNLLRVLANEDRLLILCQLIQGERNVGELQKTLNIHQPTLSQQLTVLREEGLVETRRAGKYVYYRATSTEAIQIMRTLSSLYCGRLLSSFQ